MSIIPSAIWGLLLEFRSAFSAPTFENFVMLTVGWVLCLGEHRITGIIRAGRDYGPRKHHSVFYNFFGRARWTSESIGTILLGLALRFVVGKTIHLLVDDTLSGRSGPHIWGAGMHHDARRSTYMRGGGGKRTTILTYGHSWVVVSVWVPLPWNPERGLAIPVHWELYRQKKRCPEEEYRKRTEIGRDLLVQVLEQLSSEYRVFVVGDREYCCRTVVPIVVAHGATFIGPMPKDAAFYEVPSKEPPRRGRPRKKGERLPNPQKLANDDSVPWEKWTVTMYRKQVTFLAKTQIGLWYTVAGTQLGRMLVTRDPRGRIEDAAYFSTDHTVTCGAMMASFARRWAEEIMHRDIKQHLGFESPQNGWWRRAHGTKSAQKQPGPQPHAHKGSAAVRRTTTIPFVAYALTVLHYFQVGSPSGTVSDVLARSPWYRHKAEPSFADMLATARRALWAHRFAANPDNQADLEKTAAALPEWLLEAA